MIRLKHVLMVVLLLVFNFTIYAQMDISNLKEVDSNDYSDCAAIFHNGNMLVDSYSPDGKCELVESATGDLTLSTVSLSENGATATASLSFRVAIKHGETNTLYLLTPESVKEISLNEILKECKHGDNIVILTDNKRYTLPHHEIDVLWK